MLLNQIRSASLHPYDIIKRSFSEVGGRKEEPQRLEMLDSLQEKIQKGQGNVVINFDR